MIKDREIAMVQGASLALEYRNKNPRDDDNSIISFVVKTLSATPDVKVFGIAAASEILKLRRNDAQKTDKQLLQSFVNNSFEFVSRIN